MNPFSDFFYGRRGWTDYKRTYTQWRVADVMRGATSNIALIAHALVGGNSTKTTAVRQYSTNDVIENALNFSIQPGQGSSRPYIEDHINHSNLQLLV